MMDVVNMNVDQTYRSHQPLWRHAGSPDHARHTGAGHSQTHHATVDDCHTIADRRILDQVKLALHDSGFEPLRRLRAYCDHGRITLQGRVSTYYLKQVAQEVVRSVPNVRDIDNDLHVLSRY